MRCRTAVRRVRTIAEICHRASLPGEEPRVLNDGCRYEMIKRYRQPAELTAYAAGVSTLV